MKVFSKKPRGNHFTLTVFRLGSEDVRIVGRRSAEYLKREPAGFFWLTLWNERGQESITIDVYPETAEQPMTIDAQDSANNLIQPESSFPNSVDLRDSLAMNSTYTLHADVTAAPKRKSAAQTLLSLSFAFRER